MKTVLKTRESGLPMDCVPYAFCSVGNSHLPILPMPNSTIQIRFNEILKISVL